MAVLSKHGVETHRFDKLTESYSVRSTGEVLVNKGFGWKMARWKDATKPMAENIEMLRRNTEEVSPLFARYRSLVQDAFPLSVRWKFFALLKAYGPEEIDGIVCDLQDDGVQTSIDEIQEILWARQAWIEWRKENKGKPVETE